MRRSGLRRAWPGRLGWLACAQRGACRRAGRAACSVVQGLVALLSSFAVLRSEFLRDCFTYLLGLLLTFLCLLDGEVSLLEVGPARP